MLRIIAFTVALYFVSTKSAYAYIDPATGTLIVQLLIAAVATGIATVKLWWYKVKMFFKGEKPEESANINSDPKE